MSKTIVTRIGKPAEIISLDLIKEYIGLDDDRDAEQGKSLPVLRQAVIEQGEQITGIRWAAASCLIEGLQGCGTDLVLPVSPVTEVEKVTVNGAEVDSSQYRFIPSAIDMGRPWGALRSASGWYGEITVTCTAGWTDQTLPDSLKSWALVRIATLYDYREDLVTGTITEAMPRHHVDGLLDRWRVIGSPYA